MSERRTNETKQSIAMIHALRYGTILCIIGVVLNLSGNGISKLLNLPMPLAAIGTVFTAAAGGALPGIITAFLTDVLSSLRDYNMLSFGFITMLVAVVTDFFVRRGFFEKLWKALLTIPVLSLMMGALSFLVSYLLKTPENSFMMNWHYHGLEMILAVVLTFVVLKFFPSVKENRQHLVLMEKASHTKTRLVSMRFRIMMILAIVCFLIAASITAVSYKQFYEDMVDQHISLGQGATDMIKGQLNPDKIDSYIKYGHQSAGYDKMENYLYELKENYPDIEYIYIYRMLEDKVQVVFDLDTEEWEGDKPGELIDYELVLNNLKDRFYAGERVEPMISNDMYGYVLSVFEPIYDRKGNVTCYACVDFSMKELNNSIRKFIIHVVTMFIGFVILIFAICIVILEHDVIIPVNRMAEVAGSFAYTQKEERLANVQHMRELNVRTGDEIENLYLALRKTTEDCKNYLDGLREAKTQVHTMEERVTQISAEARKDALTGVKNKSAYDQMSEVMDKSIEDKTAEFAVVMIDLNHLKKTNDTFGHEKGDIYIKGSCQIICDVYKYSPVFRYGGDEFIVILTGRSLMQRDVLMKELMGTFALTSFDSSVPEWEEYSASAGMAVFDAEVDTCVADVFKRADKNMYEHKTALKAQRRD